MKPWGLIASGVISRTFLGRVPTLARDLGPVVSTSFRVASRIANMLRAGTPVRNSAELQPAQVILVCVPGARPGSLLDQSFLRIIDWSGKVVLLCDCAEDLSLRNVLAERGALTGSLTSLPELPGCMLLEGDRAATRAGQAIALALQARTFHVPRAQLLMFRAAITASGSLFVPLLETAVACLQHAGLKAPVAAAVAESLFQHSLRAYKRAGRRSWSGPIAQVDRHSINAQAGALRNVKPLMGDLFHSSAEHAFQMYRMFPELTRYRKALWEKPES